MGQQNSQNFNRFIQPNRRDGVLSRGRREKGVSGCQRLNPSVQGVLTYACWMGLWVLRCVNVAGGCINNNNMAEGTPIAELPSPLAASAFLLRKQHSHPNITVFLDFAPPSPLSSGTPCSPSPCMPRFNADSLHYTPTFSLPVDSSRYTTQSSLYLSLHNRKVGEVQQQKSILMVPRPSRNNSYCCVCKMAFEDYLTHLNTPAHGLLVRSSEYTQRINELCEAFGMKHGRKEGQTTTPAARKRGRPAKTKPISKLPSLASKRSLSGKETDESNNNRQEDLAHQLAA